MSVLVSNKMPFVVWRIDGGLVGACKTQESANEIMWSLKADFPDRDYVCRDVDGQVIGGTRFEILITKDGEVTITEDDNGSFRFYRRGELVSIHGTENKAREAANRSQSNDI